MKKLHFLLLLILTISINSFSQTCINYTTADGLPSEMAIRVHVGADGSINLGCQTSSGGFIVYKNNVWHSYTSSNSSMPLSTVWSIEDGNAGKLWLGDYYSGLACFDIATETWQSFKTSNSDLPTNWVNGIANNGNNSLWIGTQNGLVLMNTIDNSMEIFNPTNSTLEGNAQLWLDTDQNGNVWFYCYNYTSSAQPLGLGRFDGNNFELFTTTNSDLTSNELLGLEVIDDTVWVATIDKGLFSYSNETWNNYSSQINGRVNSIKKDSEGKIWFSSSYGLYCKDGTEFTQYTINDGLAWNALSGIDVDAYNNVWIVYGSEGVSVFSLDAVTLPASISGKIYLDSEEVHPNAVECYLYNIAEMNTVSSLSPYTSNGYCFSNVIPGTYLIKAKVITDTLQAADTYYNSASLWTDAQMIIVESDSAYNYDIDLLPIQELSGNCTIQGQILYDDSQKSSIGVPNINVFVLTSDEEITSIARSDDQGLFTLENLPYADEYNVLCDITGYENIGFYENITFTEQNQTISDYFFYVDTVENSINTISSGVDLNTKNYNIQLYPNPANNYLTITTTSDKQALAQDFEIINVVGEQVYKGEFRNNLTIQIQHLNAGMYVIKFSNGETIKFIKKD